MKMANELVFEPSVVESMFRCMEEGDPIYLPSKMWIDLNRGNLKLLDSHGIDNFKRTIALNYFTWMFWKRYDQVFRILRYSGPRSWPAGFQGFFSRDPTFPTSWLRQACERAFTQLLWRLTQRVDREGLLSSLEEPRQGNPFRIYMDGKAISQDIANSVLEYYSIREHFVPPQGARPVVYELGAGYGRNAFVFLKAIPKCKYVIIDIPPALYVAQSYLTSVFPERSVFRYRCFADFSEAEAEFEACDMAFILPHQAAMLPPKSSDLFINISSLGEMTPEQINQYFNLIEKLTKTFFYTKQWFTSRNRIDGLVVNHDDYPVPTNWRQLMFRPAKVQPAFFEAMYGLD